MFRTKLVNSNATIALKPPKLDNLRVNVVVVVTIHNQQPEQQMLKKMEPVKAKGVED
jgi:hypothetical protein